MVNSQPSIDEMVRLAANWREAEEAVKSGAKASPTPTVSWLTGKKHTLNKGSIHSQFIYELSRRGAISYTDAQSLMNTVRNGYGKNGWFFRELYKQGLIEYISSTNPSAEPRRSS